MELLLFHEWFAEGAAGAAGEVALCDEQRQSILYTVAVCAVVAPSGGSDSRVWQPWCL